MDSNSEDRVGTCIKTNQFLLDNADDLASNPSINDEREILEADTETVFQKDSTATRNLEGYTTAKGIDRTGLEDMILLVRAGCRGYYTLNSDPRKLGVLSFSDTNVRKGRDNNVYVIADQVHDIADPIKASLAPFQVTVANVNAIPTLMQAYKTSLPSHRAEEGVNKAAGEERDRKLDFCFEITLPRLDNYLLPFKYTNAELYSRWETARAIDDSGGGSDSTGYTVENYVLAPGQTVNFGQDIAADRGVYIRQLGGTEGVIVCSGAADNTVCASGTVLTPGATVKELYGDLVAFGPAFMNFTNAGTATVTVRAGLKNE